MSADGEQGGVLAMAKVINGPHLPVPANSRYTLDELRDVRWGLLTKQEQGMRLMEARAVLAAAPATDTPEVDRYSQGREAGIRETLAEVADMMKVSGHLVHPIFIPAVEGLVRTLAKHPTSPEEAA